MRVRFFGVSACGWAGFSAFTAGRAIAVFGATLGRIFRASRRIPVTPSGLTTVSVRDPGAAVSSISTVSVLPAAVRDLILTLVQTDFSSEIYVLTWNRNSDAGISLRPRRHSACQSQRFRFRTRASTGAVESMIRRHSQLLIAVIEPSASICTSARTTHGLSGTQYIADWDP